MIAWLFFIISDTLCASPFVNDVRLDLLTLLWVKVLLGSCTADIINNRFFHSVWTGVYKMERTYATMFIHPKWQPSFHGWKHSLRVGQITWKLRLEKSLLPDFFTLDNVIASSVFAAMADSKIGISQTNLGLNTPSGILSKYRLCSDHYVPDCWKWYMKVHTLVHLLKKTIICHLLFSKSQALKCALIQPEVARFVTLGR